MKDGSGTTQLTCICIKQTASSDEKAITSGRLAVNRERDCIRNLAVRQGVSVLPCKCIVSTPSLLNYSTAPLLDNSSITRQA